VVSQAFLIDYPRRRGVWAGSPASRVELPMQTHESTRIAMIGLGSLRFSTACGPWGRPEMALFLFTEETLAGRAD
jgi:hypothetical protein